MSDLLTAIGLAIVIEGALYALFPGPMKKMMLRVLGQPYNHMRIGGILAACFGVALIWLMRG